MKNFCIKALVFVCVIGLTSFVSDRFLMPGSFYLHKGDKINLHLLSGDNFTKEGESQYNASQTLKFNLYEGKKVTDLTKVTADKASPVLNYTLNNTGLGLIEMSSKPQNDIVPRDEFLAYLTDQGYDAFAEKNKNATKLNFVERQHLFLKTLFSVDDKGGNLYKQNLQNEFEIVLQQNPFKQNYGDDMSAAVYFKGKPLKDCNVMLYIRTTGGTVVPQKFSTDTEGKIYFNLTRNGVYMLRAMQMIEAPEGGDVDFITWNTTFTFAFTNNEDLPNTYKEFGLGDTH
ncbi:DUF4198 domain-containing protein [Mucilaginibacter pallidiroseus]|uniref:DUF4198 domain-containing protein n=1 Tax=Mucilaginibacter pallidiroseus TaxID=2599295 RepID=A0A563UH18_9SPHI|nr:DUF4198 domain-containing protein [Mucilaginibacter pallidiroseus]TWR30641.1 DUF4198 domain-containing protein [Mucilaginibacter pallidiroseus]